MSALHSWHNVVRTRDPNELAILLAEDVVFHSPVMHRAMRGRAFAMAYLTAAMQIIGNPNFRYVREIAVGDEALLEFETEIDGVYVNGVDLIRFCDGKIVDFKVMLRPTKALEVVQAKMAERLQKN